MNVFAQFLRLAVGGTWRCPSAVVWNAFTRNTLYYTDINQERKLPLGWIVWKATRKTGALVRFVFCTHAYAWAGLLTSQTEEGDEQDWGHAEVQGPRRVAVHFGVLAGAHLYPEVCDVRHGWFPWICHHDGQVVVGFVQVLKKADQGVRIWGETRRTFVREG